MSRKEALTDRGFSALQRGSFSEVFGVPFRTPGEL